MQTGDHLPFRRKLAFSAAAFALLLLLLVAAAAIGEVVMRSVAPRSDAVKLGVRMEGSPRLYGLAANASAMQTGVMVQTNSLGFREREYPLERSPGVRRIVVLGDSYTQGVGVEFQETFSKRLEPRLERAWGPSEVINFGVSGYNTVLELATLRETAAQFKPDLIVVGYVLNDIEISNPASEARAGLESQSLVDQAHTGLKRRSMLYRHLAPKIGRVLGMFGARYAVGMTSFMMASYDEASPGWVASRQALLGIAAEARQLDARLLVVVFPAMNDFRTYPLSHAHEAITRFCTQNGIDVLDLLPRFRREKVAELTVFLDGHPNSRAHAIFAEEIFAYLSRRYASLGSAL